jgi:hypothetical protein
MRNPTAKLRALRSPCVRAVIWTTRPRQLSLLPINLIRLAWSRSTLLYQRGSALADFLELHFKATKLLRA